MKLVIQRVNNASVTINGKIHSSIGRGLMVLFGVEKEDTEDMCAEMVHKTLNLRIFDDDNGKMGRSLKDVDGELLIVSQFTLAGNCKKGLRPDFTSAMKPDTANEYYEKFISLCGVGYFPDKIKTGVFAAYMQVALENDGPVTIILESGHK